MQTSPAALFNGILSAHAAAAAPAQRGNGFCVYGQPPVHMPAQVDTFACLGDIVGRVKAERAEKAAAEAAEHRDRDAVHIKAPTRDERIAALRGDIARAQHELADLDNTQRWGRWTQDEFARQCEPARARKAVAVALLADMEGGAL